MIDTISAPPENRDLFSLHEEDAVTQQDSHDEQLTYLKYALRRALPDWFVGRELAVYWIPGERQYPYAGPDILVARLCLSGRERPDSSPWPPQEDPTVYLTYEDGPLTLVAEVASENTRGRDQFKQDRSYTLELQVPEYLFINLHRGVLELSTLAGDHYAPLEADLQGELRSPELRIGFAWQEDRRPVRVLTHEGQVIPTQQEEAALRAAVEARAEAEHTRAEAERQRADALAAELERLRRATDEQA